MPQQHEVEAVIVRSRKADRISAAWRPSERALCRVSQADPGRRNEDGSVLQADSEGLRSLPRADESRSDKKGQRVLKESQLGHIDPGLFDPIHKVLVLLRVMNSIRKSYI